MKLFEVILKNWACEGNLIVNAYKAEDAVIKAFSYLLVDQKNRYGNCAFSVYNTMEITCKEIAPKNQGVSCYDVVSEITYYNDNKMDHPIQEKNLLKNLIRNYKISLGVLSNEEFIAFKTLKMELQEKGIIQSPGLEPRMKFETADEMYQFLIYDGDLYSPSLEKYIFSYNDRGSIAHYDITKEEAFKLVKQVEGTDECWSGCLGPGGWIVDSNGDDDPAPILEFLEDYIGADDWYDTRDYANIVKKETPEKKKFNITLSTNSVSYGCNVMANSPEEALALAIEPKIASKLTEAIVNCDREEIVYEYPSLIMKALAKLKKSIESENKTDSFDKAFLDKLTESIDAIADEIGGDKYRQDWHGWCEDEAEAKEKTKERNAELSGNIYSVEFGFDDNTSIQYTVIVNGIEEALECVLNEWFGTFESYKGCTNPNKIKNAKVCLLSVLETGIMKELSVRKYHGKEEIIDALSGEIKEKAKNLFGLTPSKKKFKVVITETIEETVTVEAESEEEAEEIADNMVYNGDIILGDSLGSFSNIQYEVEEV